MGSLARLCIPDVMPQLDSPISVCARRRRPVPEVRRKATMPRGGYPDESDSDSHDNRSHDEQRHYQNRGGRPPDRENKQDRGYPRKRKNPQMIDDPLMMVEPPDDGGPLGNGRPQR